MLPTKIKLTNQIIDSIRAARITKRTPAATLSRAIKRDDSYISSLELKRIRSIRSDDLVAILCFLYGISEHDAEEKAEEIIGIRNKADNSPSSDSRYSSSSGGGKDAQRVGEQIHEYGRYDTGTDYAGPELIGDILEVLTGLIAEFYKSEPKEAVYALSSFIKSMKFDPIFAMGVMGIPFYALKTFSIEERKEVLSVLSCLFREYVVVANHRANSLIADN